MAEQICPQFQKAPKISHSSALHASTFVEETHAEVTRCTRVSRLASSNTMAGLLPPNSSVTRLNESAAACTHSTKAAEPGLQHGTRCHVANQPTFMTLAPVGPEPVKVTLSTPGCDDSTPPTRPSPVST